MSDPTPSAEGRGPAGVLLSRDMIFTSKVTGTAKLLGHWVVTAGGVDLARQVIGQWHPKVVFVDLSAGDLVTPESIAGYKRAAGDGTAFVAFGSHVDTAGLAAAREAGCDLVLPRSKFTSDLPDLIRRYLGEGEAD